MTKPLKIVVTDASPLITLAAGESLQCLTMFGVPVIIPDMVYFEVTRDIAKLGASILVEWVRDNSDNVRIAPTDVFAEFQILCEVNPKTKSKGRGEKAAAEILQYELDNNKDFVAGLLYEDSDVRSRAFGPSLHERVVVFSTGDLLLELESAGLIQSAKHILDVAEQNERNVSKQREPVPNEQAREVVRDALVKNRDHCAGL